MFSVARVLIKEEPGVTLSTFLPSFMSMDTEPFGERLILIQRSSATRIRVTTVIVIIAANIIVMFIFFASLLK
jgi:hypothetical protein